MIFVINTENPVEIINALTGVNAETHVYTDISDAWCELEANFRLKEMFKMKDHEITKNVVDTTKTTIRKVLDDSEQLYDDMDDAISKAIGVSKPD